MKTTTETVSAKQRQKMLIKLAYHDGFRAACEAMRKVYSGAEHKEIRRVINAVDHVQGDPAMVRLFRDELLAKTRK